MKADLGWRRLEARPIPSATCPRERVLLIQLRPDFSVVFEGYAGGAEHPSCAKRLGCGLSGPIFSGPHDCLISVLSLQTNETKGFFFGVSEHFEVRGMSTDGTEIELLPRWGGPPSRSQMSAKGGKRTVG